MDSTVYFLSIESNPEPSYEEGKKYFQYGTVRDSNANATIEGIESFIIDDLAEITIQDSALNDIYYQNNLAEVNSFKKLVENWDSHHSNAPSELSIQNAQSALSILYENNIHPSNLLPTSDGGVLLRIDIPEGYILIEFYNNGDIVLLSKKNGDRNLFEIELDELANVFSNPTEIAE